MLIRKIRKDKYLKEFIKFCKEKYKENLMAVIIYGSYAWGYFDRKESDYDVAVIFRDKTPSEHKEIDRRFPKVFLQYFCTADELLKKVEAGHFTIYVTFLKSARVLYWTKDYKKVLKELKKVDFIEELADTTAMQYKANYEINCLKKLKGYKGAKWALPCIRKRLQLLTYIRRRKPIWKLKKVVKMNKDLLDKEERKFILELDKEVKQRREDFGKEDREMAIKILEKLNKKIIFEELGRLIK